MVTLRYDLQSNDNHNDYLYNFQTLTKTTELAEQNIEKLGTETKRLKKHSINACSWGIWIMLLFIFIVFFFMILFIRIAPK